MALYFENLIDRYHFGQLTEDEKEMFFLALEYSPKLRAEFKFFLQMKYFLLNGKIEKFDKFLTENKLR